MDATDCGWLTPLMHIIEPPEYHGSTEAQRMRRTWVAADGSEKALPSLLERPVAPSRPPPVAAPPVESREEREARIWLKRSAGAKRRFKINYEPAYVTLNDGERIRCETLKEAFALVRLPPVIINIYRKQLNADRRLDLRLGERHYYFEMVE